MQRPSYRPGEFHAPEGDTQNLATTMGCDTFFLTHKTPFGILLRRECTFLSIAVLSANGINEEHLYAFVERSGEHAVIIFRIDAPDKAIEVLQKNGMTVLAGQSSTACNTRPSIKDAMNRQLWLPGP